jgi:hypothetical protein
MTDRNELQALQASFRGALATSAALGALAGTIEALTPDDEISRADVEELARVALAHAVASQALRGLVETMRARRSTNV